MCRCRKARTAADRLGPASFGRRGPTYSPPTPRELALWAHELAPTPRELALWGHELAPTPRELALWAHELADHPQFPWCIELDPQVPCGDFIWRFASQKVRRMTEDIGAHFVNTADAHERAQAALVGVPKDSVVVGMSAAAIWGMPLPPSVAQVLKGGPVSLSRRNGATPIRRPRVNGHSIDIPASHCVLHGSLIITTPARTWVDCAALVPPDHLLAMGDWALGRGLLTRDAINSIIAWARGRRGVVRAREVLPWIRTGVESGQESRLRWQIVANQLPEPDINAEVVVPGPRVMRLDLAYRGLRIALEFDGEWHFGTQEHDSQRRRQLEALGWKVLVATKDDLFDPTGFLNQVRSEIAQRYSISKRRW